MNPYDQKNLEFLMQASPEIIAKWYKEVSEDDHKYAMELLEWASFEMDKKSLVAAAKACLMAEPDLTDLTLANQALATFCHK